MKKVFIVINLLISIIVLDIVQAKDYIDNGGAFIVQEFKIPELYSFNDLKLYTSYEEAASYIRECISRRDRSITINIKTDDSFDIAWQKLYEVVIYHTGNPVYGDYILWQHGTYYIGGDTSIKTITFYDIDYYTTKEQEEELNNKIQEVMLSLDMNNDNDYQKVVKIYDYITHNVEYDVFNKSNIIFTAYDALINHMAVCQGYSVLFYRMALEAGLDARVIAGYDSDGLSHSWNIVKIGDYYYNLDTTFDTPYVDTGYKYFLKSNANFEGHIRHNGIKIFCDENGEDCEKVYFPYYDYENDEFNKKYPISLKNFDEYNVIINDKIVNMKLGDIKKIKVMTDPIDETMLKDLKIESSNTNIAIVDNEGNIKAISEGNVTIIVTLINGNSDKINLIVSDIYKGDYNNNDKIDLTDVLTCLKLYFGSLKQTNELISLSDVNGNNKIDLTDILFLLKRYFQND